MMSNFVVQTKEFEGPVEKLLNLIEERKLFISDISLARVTDDYIQYVEALEEHSIDDTAEFIVIASTLVLIKSKSLLPDMELSEEEEKDIEDLEDRLAKHKQIRHLSQYIRSAFGQEMMFTRRDSQKVYFAAGSNCTVENLHTAMGDIIERLPSPPDRPTAEVGKVERLDDVLKNIQERLASEFRLNFTKLSKEDAESKKGVIVRFLALLELVKQDVVKADQPHNFARITVESREINTPQYH